MTTSSEQRPRRVIGIDPGLNTTGYGVLEVGPRGPRLIEAGVVRGGSDKAMSRRVEAIHAGIAGLLAAVEPQAVAIEELYSHYQRPRTAILMGHARGVICLAASQANVPVTHYAATHVKKILTGSGRAPKSQVQMAVQRELRLEQVPEPHDVADALAIALCYYYLGSRHDNRWSQAAPVRSS